jgi:hypothetical protein
MSTHIHEFKITGQEDISKLDFDQHHIHIKISSIDLDITQFRDLFQRVADINSLRILQVDFSGTQLSDEKIEILADCLKRINLDHFHIDLSNCELSDSQLERLLRPLYDMSGLSKLHLVFENVNISPQKKELIHDCFKKLPYLKNARLNIRNSKMLTETDISSLRNTLSGYDEHSLIDK